MRNMVRPKRFELLTPWFVGRLSILLILNINHLQRLQIQFLVVFSLTENVISPIM